MAASTGTGHTQMHDARHHRRKVRELQRADLVVWLGTQQHVRQLGKLLRRGVRSRVHGEPVHRIVHEHAAVPARVQDPAQHVVEAEERRGVRPGDEEPVADVAPQQELRVDREGLVQIASPPG
ncbi:MAG: hypothetical protein ACLFV0_04780 [Nitriliruptoraceae bacterium]